MVAKMRQLHEVSDYEWTIGRVPELTGSLKDEIIWALEPAWRVHEAIIKNLENSIDTDQKVAEAATHEEIQAELVALTESGQLAQAA